MPEQQKDVIGKIRRFIDSKKPKLVNPFSADSIELEDGRIIALNQVGENGRPYKLSFRKGCIGLVAFLMVNNG